MSTGCDACWGWERLSGRASAWDELRLIDFYLTAALTLGGSSTRLPLGLYAGSAAGTSMRHTHVRGVRRRDRRAGRGVVPRTPYPDVLGAERGRKTDRSGHSEWLLGGGGDVVCVSGSTGGDGPSAGWDRLRAELTARLDAIADVDAVIVEVIAPLQATAVQPQESWFSKKFRSKPPPGGQPYVQFAALEENWLHMEASSNQFLAPQNQLDDAAVATLGRLGWSPPTAVGGGGLEHPNYFVDRPLAETPEMAAMAVQTLTEAFGATDASALRITQV